MNLGTYVSYLRQWFNIGDGTTSHLDPHVAMEWTRGRLRLDAVLALMRKLKVSLEKEIERLGCLDPSSPLFESLACKKVAISLRGYTFDKHLRDECRVLIPLLQFCARDLTETQGIDMTHKLMVLAQIQAGLESA